MLGRYLAPDVLPKPEEYGFENEEGASSPISRAMYKSSSGEFSFEFSEVDNDLGSDFALLYGKMVSISDNVTVGRLCGDLVNRCSRDFFDMCDDRSQQLMDLAQFVANADGTLRQPLRTEIKDAARIKAAGKGGLLFLDEVHLLPAYRGRDLSLEFVLALLRHLRGRWTLAMSMVVPWDHADQQRDEVGRGGAFKRTAEERTRLCRHFARLGLRQVGSSAPSGHHYWYLERSQLPEQPLPRGALAALTVYHPTPPPVPSELDQQLATAAQEAIHHGRDQQLLVA